MRPPLTPPPRITGFSLASLLITAGVLLIGGSVVLNFNTPQWRRAQVNAAAMGLSEWLEEVSASPERDGLPCVVTIQTGSSRAAGSVLATVSPASCSSRPSLRLDSMHGRRPYAVGATATSFTFTPRGAVTTETGAGAASTAVDLEMRLSVQGQAPMRCVRVFGSLGLIRLARNNSSGAVTTACTELSRV